MNPRIALLALALNAAYVVSVATAVQAMIDTNLDVRERAWHADHGLPLRRPYETPAWAEDDLIEARDDRPEIVDLAGLTIVEPMPHNDLWRPYSGDDYRSLMTSLRRARAAGCKIPFCGMPESLDEEIAIAREIDEENLASDNVLGDVIDPDELQIHVNDMRCAVERFENPEAREWHSGLYS
jgi:hypothetical protein